jgi:hypothetical protein
MKDLEEQRVCVKFCFKFGKNLYGDFSDVATALCCTAPSGRAFYGVGLRSLAGWDCGFESHRGHGCLSDVSVVCCQVEVSATG